MTGARLGLSIVSRLTILYGAIAVGSVAAAAAAFYLGSVGVLERLTDAKIVSVTGRLEQAYRAGGLAPLQAEVNRQLYDKVDTDTELFLVEDAAGHALLGNLSARPGQLRDGSLVTVMVWRDRHLIRTRVLATPLGAGARLIVGRDLRELDALQGVLKRATAVGLLVAILCLAGGGWLLRRAIARRLGEMRRTAHQVGAGDLAQRVPATGTDEFAMLSRDINDMLARIERLMEGVRQVSNALAHDLRSPLSRVRNRLAAALANAVPGEDGALAAVASESIADIDRLIVLFEKLLRIAAAEAGMRVQHPQGLDPGQLVRDLAELYEAAAEERGMVLRALPGPCAPVLGDADLLASALGSVLDNALKYAGAGAVVELSCAQAGADVVLRVRDTGPGVPDAILPRLAERFFRADQARHQSGHGIGLCNVRAIIVMHGGALMIRNAHPGLEVSLILPERAAGLA